MNRTVHSAWRAVAYDRPEDREIKEWCVLAAKIIGVSLLLAGLLAAASMGAVYFDILPDETVAPQLWQTVADLFSIVSDVLFGFTLIVLAKAYVQVAREKGYID